MLRPIKDPRGYCMIMTDDSQEKDETLFPNVVNLRLSPVPFNTQHTKISHIVYQPREVTGKCIYAICICVHSLELKHKRHDITFLMWKKSILFWFSKKYLMWHVRWKIFSIPPRKSYSYRLHGQCVGVCH